jgi:two-component system copper resistance phosphate regulon response regulator CusR
VRILVVEDDPTTREFLERGLRTHGILADLASSCAEGLERALAVDSDVVVLDVMLPDGSGFDLLERLRARGVCRPTVFLSARGDVSDRLRGFELGADDYLAKPFALAELVARIRSVARRRIDEGTGNVLRVADLEVDPGGVCVRRAGRHIELSLKQFSLVELFARNVGLVLSRPLILERVWGYGFETRSNALDVQIKVLRDRLDRGYDTRLIHTVRGVGYVLEPRPAGAA